MISESLGQPAVRELIQMLRLDPRTSALPIAVVSTVSSTNFEYVQPAQDRRTTFQPLPFSVESMRRVLQQALSRGSSRPAHRDVRILRAHSSLNAMTRFASDRRTYGFYDIRRHQEAIESALFTPVLTRDAATLLGWIGSPPAQRALVDLASQDTRALADREAASAAFRRAVANHGVLLTTGEIQQQYVRYQRSSKLKNADENVLAAVIRTIEAKQGQGRGADDPQERNDG